IDDRVVGMTFSEFGRRIVSNASNGTDHGSASPVFVFGNPVRGGVIGSNPSIPHYATFEDNLDMQFDFRQLYGSLLSQWFGAGHDDVAGVLKGTFNTIPLIGKDGPGLKETMSIYPNPVPADSSTTIEFASTGGTVNVEAFDMSGRKVSTIYDGTL